MIPQQNDHLSSSSFSQNNYNKRSTCTRSNKSSKCSSRRGSTDYDSRLKFKTQTCKYWSNQVECPFGENCNFAHGEVEMRSKNFVPNKYKTKLCQKFSSEGFCPYGTRCQFVHPTLKHPRAKFETAMNCLSTASQRFFSFLEQKQQNLGKVVRLPYFCRLTGGFICTQNDSIIQQIVYELDQEQDNYVDVRSRHNSF